MKWVLAILKTRETRKRQKLSEQIRKRKIETKYMDNITVNICKK